MFEDINDSKKAKEALKDSESKFRLALRNAPVSVVAQDRDLRYIWAYNQRTATPEQILGKLDKDIFTVKEAEHLTEIKKRVLKENVDYREQMWLDRPSGKMFLDVFFEPIHDEKGNIIGVGTATLDLTKEKLAEMALKESEERFRSALDNMLEGCQIIGHDWRYIYINNAAEVHNRRPKKDLLGKRYIDVWPGIESTNIFAVIKRSLKERVPQSLENEFTFPDGTIGWFDLRIEPVPEGVFILSMDIGERKKAETSLKRQAELIDLSPDAIIVKTLDAVITFWSRGAEKLYGWTRKQAIGKRTDALLKTRYSEPVEKIISRLKTRGRWSGELVHATKSGKEVTVRSWWLVERTEQGEIKSILQSNVDISEHNEAEKEIVRSATFPMLNPNPVIEVNFDGEITYTNPATQRLFPDLQSLGLEHVFFSGWEEIVKTFFIQSAVSFERELKINERWYRQQFYYVSETQRVRVYTADVDDLKLAEEERAKAQMKLEENAILLEEYASQMESLAEQRAQQLKDAERMVAIGQTASMVGHDIRNPLQAITSDMYLINEETKVLKDNEGKKAILESINSIEENLAYINKIVSDLQDYTRPLKPNLQETNLSELIQSTILTINVPKHIEVRTDIKKNADPIKTDVLYLRRILANLFTNAVQAMSNEGKLTIKASKKKTVTIITILDTGIGVPEDAKAKMFTPLFTTKSKGQGLGLAVVKRLTEALGGSIKFESEPTKGTKFRIELPQTK